MATIRVARPVEAAVDSGDMMGRRAWLGAGHAIVKQADDVTAPRFGGASFDAGTLYLMLHT